MNSNLISNVATPASATDAVNKQYVDTFSKGSTNYIQVTSALQTGATFYVSSGTVNTLTVGTSIGLPNTSVALAALVNGTLQSGVVASSIAANSVYPVALQSAVYPNITGVGAQSQVLNMNSNLINGVANPVSAADAVNKQYVDSFSKGSTNYVQVTSVLQSGATFYVSSGTVNDLTIGTSIGLPTGSVALSALANGTLQSGVVASSIAANAVYPVALQSSVYPNITGVGAQG